MTRINTPGAGTSLPESRLTEVPFYYTNVAPPVIRWQELNWQYDAAQRWFYNLLTGRTQESIWRSEMAYQTELQLRTQGQYGDPRAWSLPHFENDIRAGMGYNGEPYQWANYLQMDENRRPANPYTGIAAQTGALETDNVDELYIAPRHTFSRVGMRITMQTPSAAEIAARGSSGTAEDVLFALGFEVNSQGGTRAYWFGLYDNAATLQWQVTSSEFSAWEHSNLPARVAKAYNNRPFTINNPGAWADYYLEYDPPVFRIIQPTAGQTNFAAYPDLFEWSIESLGADAAVQPFMCNESLHYTGDDLTWNVGQWAITPLHRPSNVYSVHTRTNPNGTCSPFARIFDTGGRPFLHINVKTLGCGCTYYIYHAETGEDQMAGYPEVRTWRRIDDSDYTGTTGTPSGESGIGLFNAGRFIKVQLPGCNACGTEEIVYTANDGLGLL